MKTLLNQSKSALLILMFLIGSYSLFSQTYSSKLIGQNSWMPSFIKENGVLQNGKFEELCPKLADAGVKMIRVGGITYDNYITNAQYDLLITAIKNAGAIPLVQISHKLTYQQAFNVVTYLKNKWGIKYWSIGNEPDHIPVTISVVAQYIKTIAPAIRDVDPTAIIFGGDFAWYNEPMIKEMLGVRAGGDPNNNVSGKDAKGRYYINVLAYHSYEPKNVIDLENRITKLKVVLDKVNLKRTSSPIGWAMTEFNITAHNDAVTDLKYKAWSFYAGQLLAELYGLGMKYNAVTICPWSTHQSDGKRDDLDLGVFDTAPDYAGRSNYYHGLMLAKYKKSKYMPATTNNDSVSVVATKDGTGYQVMILNKSSKNLNYTLRFDNTTITSTKPLKINLTTGTLAKYYAGYIAYQATRLLIFNASGNLTMDWSYNARHAVDRKAPVVNSISANASANNEEITELNEPNDNNLNLNIFQNINSKGSFTIHINSIDLNANYQVQIADLNGKTLFNKNIKNDITLNNWKNGIYIVSVYSQESVIHKKFIIK